MRNNPLKQLGTLGQSIWVDYIRRDLMASGELRRLTEEDGLRGMTSIHPSSIQGDLRQRPVQDAGCSGARVQRLLWASTSTKNAVDKLMQTLAQRSPR